uniref:Uncharacterized protein n=1 Tax=Hucho hucho TaxID=62062 RepID=A0A4W5P7X6_9TELE
RKHKVKHTLSLSLSLQLRKAVMDHISDSFLETNVPLLVLIEAAKSGNEKEVKEYAQVFREHANKLVEGIGCHLGWNHFLTARQSALCSGLVSK